MATRSVRDSRASYQAWSLDQLTKSEFFHQKLHEWKLLEVAYAIEGVKRETLDWDWDLLGIVEQAWNKVIHRGIKPVIVFAHPVVLQRVSRAVGYYRTLAMVSQKSMSNVGLAVNRYEAGKAIPDDECTLAIAQRLNRIISHLVQSDEGIDAREFDLWRGMAAGSQAQGSWQNLKGKRVEITVKGILRRRLQQGLCHEIEESYIQIYPGDEQRLNFRTRPSGAVNR